MTRLDPVTVALSILVVGGDELDAGVPGFGSPRLLGLTTLVDVLSAVLALFPSLRSHGSGWLLSQDGTSAKVLGVASDAGVFDTVFLLGDDTKMFLLISRSWILLPCTYCASLMGARLSSFSLGTPFLLL
jgi:hypothetical protein